MFTIIATYIALLIILFWIFVYTKRQLLSRKKIIYTELENYYFALHTFFLNHKEAFYRKDKWVSVIFNTKTNFLKLKNYSLGDLKKYANIYNKDIDYLSSLFDLESHFTKFTTDTDVYTQWIMYEKVYSSIRFVLWVMTLWIWSLFMSEK